MLSDEFFHAFQIAQSLECDVNSDRNSLLVGRIILNGIFLFFLLFLHHLSNTILSPAFKFDQRNFNVSSLVFVITEPLNLCSQLFEERFSRGSIFNASGHLIHLPKVRIDASLKCEICDRNLFCVELLPINS